MACCVRSRKLGIFSTKDIAEKVILIDALVHEDWVSEKLNYKLVKSCIDKMKKPQLKLNIQSLSEFHQIICKLKHEISNQPVTFNFNSNGFTITTLTMTNIDRLAGFGYIFNIGKDEFCSLLKCDKEIKFEMVLSDLDCLIYHGLKTDDTMDIIIEETDMIITFPSTNEINVIYARN